jgi:dUTP pyrophosphatase
MKANLPKNPINTPEQAVTAAQKVVEGQEEARKARKFEFEAFMDTIQQIDPQLGGFDELAMMLTLSDESFAILAPEFLAELERGMKNTNDRLLMVQSMNMLGMTTDDVKTQYEALFAEIDAEMKEYLSQQKIDFLKQMLGITYNILSESEGIAKRNILIPIEYCREDAKMPTYAHLTDAGMDIYLTEDVVIHPGETVLIPTGIKVAIPLGYELQVRPKSGRSLKSKLRIANTPGTIDAGYRDEIGVICDNIDPVIRSAKMDDNGRLYDVEWGSDIMLSKGEKIAQLVLSEVPKAIFYEVESVANMGEDRGGGFGSTGNK